jgi:CubicO group peptidase (beta-lactamase class C family)
MLPETTMMAYSMSKTFTACAVVRLLKAANIDLDASIDLFLDFVQYGQGVTIRRLLAHTAGVPNPNPMRWVHQPSEHDTFDDHAALLKVLRKNGRLAFTPGSKYGYSNIGYWLLGELVARLSGMPFTSFVKSQILQPLGIAPAELDYGISDMRNHARGYVEKYSLINLLKRLLIDRKFIGRYCDDWLEILPHYLDDAAFGGLVGTARGVGKFLQDQLHPQSVLFDSETRSEFYAQQRTINGTLVPTSLGWHVGSRAGATHFYKEGGGAGFHCLMRLYPEQGIGAVVMVNATIFDVRRLMDAIDPVFFGID